MLAYNKCKTVAPVPDCNPFEIVTDVIWGNERYKYKGKCLYIKSWIDSGIVYVKDILDECGRIITETDLLKKLKKQSNWIAEYCMVKSTCKHIENKSTKLEFACIRIDHNVPRLFVKGKTFDILNRKSNFYYAILRDQSFKIPYMQKVWCKQLSLDCLLFQQTWNKIYDIKVRYMPIKKLAEFNYKILSGTLPCGQILSKWKIDIPATCLVCNVKEDVKHMLFECSKVSNIWQQLGSIMQVNLRLKHVVIGYYLDQNNTTTILNWLCCLTAYSYYILYKILISRPC
jgi:hypothetical protein